MRTFLKKVPYPIAGVMLSFAAAGNIIGSYKKYSFADEIREVFGVIAGILLLILILKMIAMPKSISKVFDNLIVMSAMATLPMAVMLLAVYIKPIVSIIALPMWWIGYTLSVILIIGFTIRHTLPLQLNKVFASYFVLYVGIVVGSVTAPAFKLQWLGQLTFWYGLIIYLILLPIVIVRYKKLPVLKDPAKPIIAIFAAPANLLMVGYMSSFTQKHELLVILLLVLGLSTSVFGLIKVIQLRHLKFFPSYSAYTFPFVIGALATKKAYGFMNQQGYNMEWLRWIGEFQVVIMLVFLLVVTIRYCHHVLTA